MMEIKPGFILEGPFWKEKVRVISVKAVGADQVKIEAVGLTSNPPTYYNPILTREDLGKITVITEQSVKFTGDANRFFLFTEAQRIRNAFQFDPLYAVNVSQVDPQGKQACPGICRGIF
ncbi:MAG: hypothetical protein AB1487_10250 [Thermodesulfobacteriota bacterium]